MVPVSGGGAGAAALDGGRGGTPLAGWMEAHGDELRRHLERMLDGAEDAEDVLQEVWLTAYRNPPDRGPGSNVRAWLYRVATHAALDRLARERRRAGLLTRWRGALASEPVPSPDAGEGMGEAAREEVRRRVAALPRRQREAVWLRWIEGRDYGEVARSLECTEEAARANVYQGVKRLRVELRDLWEKEANP